MIIKITEWEAEKGGMGMRKNRLPIKKLHHSSSEILILFCSGLDQFNATKTIIQKDRII